MSLDPHTLLVAVRDAELLYQREWISYHDLQCMPHARRLQWTTEQVRQAARTLVIQGRLQMQKTSKNGIYRYRIVR